jgi:hypothetical protein
MNRKARVATAIFSTMYRGGAVRHKISWTNQQQVLMLIVKADEDNP